ncbi:MAG: hypothetical protein MdMp014T_1339 [Treponematales bacterium]
MEGEVTGRRTGEDNAPAKLAMAPAPRPHTALRLCVRCPLRGGANKTRPNRRKRKDYMGAAAPGRVKPPQGQAPSGSWLFQRKDYMGAAAPGRVKRALTLYRTTTYIPFPRYRKPVSARCGGFPMPRGDVPVLRGDVPVLRGDVPVTRGDVPVTRGDVPVARGDVPILRGDVPVLCGDVPVLCGDVPVTRGDVPVTRGDVPGRFKRFPGGRGRSSFEIFRRFIPGK